MSHEYAAQFALLCISLTRLQEIVIDLSQRPGQPRAQLVGFAALLFGIADQVENSSFDSASLPQETVERLLDQLEFVCTVSYSLRWFCATLRN